MRWQQCGQHHAFKHMPGTVEDKQFSRPQKRDIDGLFYSSTPWRAIMVKYMTLAYETRMSTDPPFSSVNKHFDLLAACDGLANNDLPSRMVSLRFGVPPDICATSSKSWRDNLLLRGQQRQQRQFQMKPSNNGNTSCSRVSGMRAAPPREPVDLKEGDPL